MNPTLCHLLVKPKPFCCIKLTQPCDHCSFVNAFQYQWKNKPILLIADHPSNGIYSFIKRLRSYNIKKSELNPIVLILEHRPRTELLESLIIFPFIYWMIGKISVLDDLLIAGVTTAECVAIVNRPKPKFLDEDELADCKTIVAVQTLFKFFPGLKIITEISLSSSLRFLQFRTSDTQGLLASRREKKEKKRDSNFPYLFRIPFASGMVFSTSMIETLLYQALVKEHIIIFIKLLLGMQQESGSGYLTTIQITHDDLWIETYGHLYQKLCTSTSEIPIGIYRTEDKPKEDLEAFKWRHRLDRIQIKQFVSSRINALNLPSNEFDHITELWNKLSYVLINPSRDLMLRPGDIVYLVHPSPTSFRSVFSQHILPFEYSNSDTDLEEKTSSVDPFPQKLENRRKSEDQSRHMLKYPFIV